MCTSYKIQNHDWRRWRRWRRRRRHSQIFVFNLDPIVIQQNLTVWHMPNGMQKKHTYIRFSYMKQWCDVKWMNWGYCRCFSAYCSAFSWTSNLITQHLWFVRQNVDRPIDFAPSSLNGNVRHKIQIRSNECDE